MSYEIKTVPLKEGGSIKVTVLGQGARRAVILPGLSIRPVSESAAALDGLYKKYTEQYTFYVLDRKTPVEAGYTMDQMAEDSLEALASLGVYRFCLFGASQGGMISQRIRARHPECLEALVLASTILECDEETLPIFYNWVRLAKERKPYELGLDMMRLVYSPEVNEANKEVFEFLAGTFTKEDCVPFEILAATCTEKASFLNEMKGAVPTLLCSGGRDRIFALPLQKRLGEALGAEMKIYPEGSHAIYDEIPNFPDVMIDFFSKQT